MRSVVFVEKIELDFSGNIFANALVLGDVDNDSLHELMVGSVDGELWIYKGDNTVPFATASNLGMIVCTEIADVCNTNKNVAVVLCADGLCYLYAIDKQSFADRQPQEGKQAESAPNTSDGQGAEETPQETRKPLALTPFHTQHLPANSKVVLVADIDNDGQLELVIGYTDRVVQAYRWQDKTMLPEEAEGSGEKGFVLLQRWNVDGQVGSLSLSKDTDGSPMLVVSQPGCNYAELKCSWVMQQGAEDDNPEDQSCSAISKDPYVSMHLITFLRARHADVSTEIVAGLSKGEKEGGEDIEPEPDRIAMCTLDGTLMLIEKDKSLWSRLVDHQLFALTKLDIMCDGWDEVVACAWDGQTYIIDHTQQSIRFHLKENVCAFTAGLYSTNGKNTPCLVYATFNNKIYIYWNVQLPRIRSANLIHVASANEELQERLDKLGIKSEDEKRELFKRLIYGGSKKSMDKTEGIS
ncbi:KICSTOR complex protein ITFG2-like [Strongylocentrotus purpuratus]|uniref:Integrin alpha FG-GAP repeat containing 2 n=1 Tax=Strongylocentrotus purpuratus TaxID=7668 RepID=A0A7M7P3T0_STRPU|nr:KICSTOR complex protein ITFG2-like [Strongylocentrotus purpuratus]